MSLLPGMEAETRDAAKSQWYTPPNTAKRIAGWALSPLATFSTVLEPSAGRGHLATEIRYSTRRVAIGSPFCVDIDPRNVESLQASGYEAVCADFLAYWPETRFDIAVMNPPFEDGQAEAHVLRALECCTHVVAHVPLTTLEGKQRRAGLWSQAQLKRLAICSTRPKYGGKGGATAMCTIHVVARAHDPGEPSDVTVEWWP